MPNRVRFGSGAVEEEGLVTRLRCSRVGINTAQVNLVDLGGEVIDLVTCVASLGFSCRVEVEDVFDFVPSTTIEAVRANTTVQNI